MVLWFRIGDHLRKLDVFIDAERLKPNGLQAEIENRHHLPASNDFSLLTIRFTVPNSLYHGRVLKIQLRLPYVIPSLVDVCCSFRLTGLRDGTMWYSDGYPIMPPAVYFIETEIYHMNVDDDGQVLLPLFVSPKDSRAGHPTALPGSGWNVASHSFVDALTATFNALKEPVLHELYCHSSRLDRYRTSPAEYINRAKTYGRVQ